MTERTHPKRIGPYRILELIGEGAWGLVYLAEQTEGVRRKVAVKVLKRGVDTDEVLARFDAERQAMALMSHPNIAQILDAGATDQGLSYFVMEFVAGEPITDYCDRLKLTVRERVELFQDVCGAIQHAHQKGIIHRDLKPTNVLVARVEGRAVPKVIDFGIAKAMHQRLTDKTLYTTQGQFIGTPGYMSPEQALQGSLEVDTTTDVYALGVMLYELMTGVLPLELRLLDMESMLKMLRETDPPKPAERLTQMGEKAAKIADARGVDLRTLKRTLRGDLTWVVARTLEKDRTQRYQAASELEAELGRYLKNEPVLAGPPGASYQLKKFVSRNKGPVATAAMLVVLLSGFTVTLGVQLQRVATEAERANRGEETAQQVSDFMVGLFQVSDPSESLGNTITAREILDIGVGRIETELADQPVVQAELMHTMGEVYLNLGLFGPAGALLQDALDLRRTNLGPRHADVASTLWRLGHYYRRTNEYASAIATLHESLSIREELLEPNDLDVASTLLELSSVLINAGQPVDSLALRAMTIRQRALGPDHPDVAEAMNQLAFVYLKSGRHEEAESFSQQSLAILDRTLPETDPRVLGSIELSGLILEQQGKLAQSERVFLRLRELNAAVYGDSSVYAASASDHLADVYRAAGRGEDAERELRYALAINEIKMGPDHPTTVKNIMDLASVIAGQGRHAEAAPLFLRALAMRENALDLDSPDAAGSLNDLGLTYWSAGNSTQSEPLLGRALAMFRRAIDLDPGDAEGWDYVCWFGSLLGRASDVTEACEQAVSLAPEDASFKDSRGLARALTGDYTGAIADFQAYVEWTSSGRNRAERQRWIEALSRGENPLSPEVLEQLR